MGHISLGDEDLGLLCVSDVGTRSFILRGVYKGEKMID